MAYLVEGLVTRVCWLFVGMLGLTWWAWARTREMYRWGGFYFLFSPLIGSTQGGVVGKLGAGLGCLFAALL